MSALVWGKKPPTEDGIYFYRPIGGTRAIAEILNGKVVFPVVGNSSVAITLQLFTGVEWAGPIPEPSEAPEGVKVDLERTAELAGCV